MNFKKRIWPLLVGGILALSSNLSKSPELPTPYPRLASEAYGYMGVMPERVCQKFLMNNIPYEINSRIYYYWDNADGNFQESETKTLEETVLFWSSTDGSVHICYGLGAKNEDLDIGENFSLITPQMVICDRDMDGLKQHGYNIRENQGEFVVAYSIAQFLGEEKPYIFTRGDNVVKLNNEISFANCMESRSPEEINRLNQTYSRLLSHIYFNTMCSVYEERFGN